MAVDDAAMPIRVVIVTAFPPELVRWTDGLPLGESLPFPQGADSRRPALRLNRSLGVLGVTTGMGPIRAAVSVTALGHDPRLELRRAYWVVAGIAGVDPASGSIGSVYVPRLLVNLGGGYRLDDVGNVPHHRSYRDRYGEPLPTESEAVGEGALHVLDGALAAWAEEVAASAELPDAPELVAARAPYVAAAAREPPAVRRGTSVTGETFWAGREHTAWAANTSAYWSGGRAVGVVTQMEDLAYAQALLALASAPAAPRANASRLVVLRAASDFTYEPRGANDSAQSLASWFFDDPLHMCTAAALDNLFRAGAPVVHALAAAAAAEEAAAPSPSPAPPPPPLPPSPPAAGAAAEHVAEAPARAVLWPVAAAAGGLALGLAAAGAHARVARRRRAAARAGGARRDERDGRGPAQRHVELFEAAA